jgi:PAS domain S-box-containing protein
MFARFNSVREQWCLGDTTGGEQSRTTMSTNDASLFEAADKLPTMDEATAILQQLAGPYLGWIEPEPLTASAQPDQPVVLRDISRFKDIESLFGSLPEALPDPLIVVNREGLIVLANTRTVELFGYRREELLGAPVELLMPPRFRRRHVGYRDEYFQAPRPRPMGRGLKLLGLRKDGGEFPVEISLNPMQTAEDLVVISTIRDISERVRQEARYRTLVEEIPAVTALAALDQGVSELYVSPQIEKLLGFSQQEWIDDPILWYKQLHPDDRERWHKEFAQTIFTGVPFRAEYRFLARDGRVVWVLGEAKVVRDEAGRPLFIHGIAFDITKMKEAEAALRAHQEDLERLVAEKTAKLQEKIKELGLFTHFASHELKKPLTHIKNEMTDPLYLTRGRRQKAVQEMADWVLGKAQDALDRTEAMLRWASVEDRQAKRLVPYDCQDVLASAGTMLKEAIAQTGAEVTSGPLPTVMAAAPRSDRDKWPELVFLFENLINNALKYRSPDRQPRVRVEARRQGGEWLFSFEDNGIGIERKHFDESVQCQIFNMFDRLHSEHKIPGHGIGLAYCKRVVESLGGTIGVDSVVGKGSTFYFTLPALANNQAIEAAFPAQGPASSEPTTSPESSSSNTDSQSGRKRKKSGSRANTRSKKAPRPGRRRK